VEGIAQEYQGITEITGPLVTPLKRSCPSPEPKVLSTGEANDSQWDGTLIQVRGEVVFTLQEEGRMRIHLNDGSGAIVVLVHKTAGIDLTSVDVDDILTVSGVGTFLLDEGSHAILTGHADHIAQQELERDLR
jgi:hypothetical protein